MKTLYGRRAPGRVLLAALTGLALLGIGPTACQRAEPEGPSRPWRVDVIHLDDDVASQDALEGLRDGLSEARLEVGRDVTLVVRSAHGDPAALGGLVEHAVRDGTRVLVTLSTAALKTALETAPGHPVVFTEVANPKLAGLRAPSWRRWLPFWYDEQVPAVTGAYATPGFRELVAAIRAVGVRQPIGTVYSPGDADSAFYRDAFVRAAHDVGLRVQALPAAGPAEVRAAAAVLAEQRVGALVALGDRVSNAAFDDLVAVANSRGLVVFGVVRSQAEGGAMVVAARGYRAAARDAGLRLARVLRGESAADLPIGQVKGTRLIINAVAAERADLGIPFSLVQRADEVIGE